MQYERAFRSRSSPGTPNDHGAGVGASDPVTFQVYTAKDIGSGRGPMRSLPAVSIEPPKPRLAVQIGLFLLAAFVLLVTGAAVLAVITDEPSRATTATPIAAKAAPDPILVVAPTPSPSTISIGDPPLDALEALEGPASKAAAMLARKPAVLPLSEPSPSTSSAPSASSTVTPTASSQKVIAPPASPSDD